MIEISIPNFIICLISSVVFGASLVTFIVSAINLKNIENKLKSAEKTITEIEKYKKSDDSKTDIKLGENNV